jgi:hypothetical protein
VNQKPLWYFTVAVMLIGIRPEGVALDLSDVLPELRTLPAPESITEGLRLNYYVSVATIAEKDLLTWVDNAGTTNVAEVPTPSGHGITQVRQAYHGIDLDKPLFLLHQSKLVMHGMHGEPILPTDEDSAGVEMPWSGGAQPASRPLVNSRTRRLAR